ncbi:bifunctional metallophosphatase/5'-nucleotidase [Myxococcota bacterium]|nr:bifunctional metallophosphatase/5'-nucleotidase [Myxococcota bacterium]
MIGGAPVLWLLVGCAARTPPSAELPPPGQAAPGTLVIAHTNDLHAHYLPERAEWREDQALLGGMVAIDAERRALEHRFGEEAVLFLDAGDVLTGTPLMELEVGGVAGGGMAVLLDTIGVDGWVPGNHEFDRGFDHAQAFVDLGQAPTLSANLRAPCGGPALDCGPALAGSEPWRIYTVNGLKVGVFGLTTSGMAHLTDDATLARMEVLGHAQAARQAVEALEPQVDLVVALTHIGLENDRLLAQEVDGIDLVVGGHSHTRMEAAERVGDTWIVQAGSYGRLLGVAELAVAEGAITQLSWAAEELDPDDLPMPADPQVQALVEGYRAELDRRFSQPAGQVTATMTRLGGGETPMGRWCSDVVRRAAGADVGLFNAGGIRADLVAGPVTVGALYEVFPFGNEVVTFEASGADLLAMMLSTAMAEVEDDRGTLQWSGVTFTWQVRLGSPEIVSAQVGGQPLDLSRRYRVATIDFVAAQWERNLGVQPQGVVGSGRKVLEAAVAEAQQGPLSPPTDRRMQRLGP